MKLIALVFIVFLVSCELSDPNINYPDRGMMETFKKALEANDIDYRSEEIGNAEHIFWSRSNNEKVKQIQLELFDTKSGEVKSNGVSPAEGVLSIIQIFEKNGVPYRVQTYGGFSYLLWEEKFDDKVKALKAKHNLPI